MTNQILHRRPVVPKNESAAKKREREDREGRLWVQGTQTLPADQKIIDFCDRGGDTFEFLEHEASSGRTFVVRSTYRRSMLPSHVNLSPQSGGEVTTMLHDFAKTLPSLGQ